MAGETPDVIIFTNSSFFSSLKRLFFYFWVPMSQKLAAPIFLPQDDPFPWHGYTLTLPSRVFNFWRESKWAAAFYSISVTTSNLPISLTSRVSPVKMQTGLESLSFKTKQVL